LINYFNPTFGWFVDQLKKVEIEIFNHFLLIQTSDKYKE